MKTKVKKCLILEWIKLPKKIQEEISGWCGFHNDCMLDMSRSSEYEPKDLSMKQIEKYMKDQIKIGEFKGTTVEEFIKEYGLQLEAWIIDKKINLEGVEKIIIDVCW